MSDKGRDTPPVHKNLLMLNKSQLTFFKYCQDMLVNFYTHKKQYYTYITIIIFISFY